MKNLLTILFFLLSLNLFAQAPWRAKLIIWFEVTPDSLVSDTIWVGCDSLGNVGFQQELDIKVDTPLLNHVYSIDNQMYFKKNIREFKKHSPVSFKLKCFGNARFIVWDSLEHYYLNDSMFMLYSELAADKNVSFDASHASGVLLYLSPGSSQSGYYINDSIEVLEGGKNLVFDLNVLFEDSSMYNGLIDIKKDNRFTIGYDNEFAYVTSKVQTNAEINIYHINGQLIYKGKLREYSNAIPIANFSKGIYVIEIIDNENYINRLKIIKY